MPAKAGRAFGAEDFIAFDFDGEEATGGNTALDSYGGSEAEAETSTIGKSRKRKAEERIDDGRSKKEREMARSRRTPWSADVDWSRCRNGAEALHRELMAFDAWLAPTHAEHETRCMVIEMIRRAIKSQWHDADVHPFGSQETQLYLPQGDLDLVVVSPTMENSRREGALRTMAACLRRHNLATNVQVIARAKVPIIKFVTTYARLKVDISINQTNGLAAAKYVNSWLRKWPHIRPIIMVIKHLLMQRGMSEVFSGGLGSYSVIIMVISFLQLHPKVQRGEIDAGRNMGVILLEILELYGKNFGYDNCGISIRGQGGYFSKARRGWKDERRPFMLSIEDPHDPTNDISKGSFGIIQVRSTLAGAFDILTAAICQQANEAGASGSGWSRASEPSSSKKRGGKHQRFAVDSDSDSDEEARQALLRDSQYDSGKEDRDPNSLLGTILGISNPVVNQRKEMEALYHSGSLQFKLGRPPAPRSPQPAPPSGPKALRRDAPQRPPTSSSSADLLHKGSGVISIIGASKAKAKEEGPPQLSIRGASALAKKRSREAAVDKRDVKAGEDASSGEEDSRYSASRVAKNGKVSRAGVQKAANGETLRKRARLSGLDISQSDLEELSHSAPSNFVSEDDESDDDDDVQLPTLSHTSGSSKSSPRIPNGTVGEASAKTAAGARLSSRVKYDFWTAKGVDPPSTKTSSPSPPPTHPSANTDSDGDQSDRT